MFLRSLQLQKRFFNSKALNRFVDLSPEVRNSLNNKKPIVALESTIITHGMPYPENVKTAKEVEEIVKSQGAVPATIAILDGRIKVGLSSNDLEKLGSLDPKTVSKVSRSDLAMVISSKRNGGTTVAGTMIIANSVGIRVFATGGIGGVHRGAEESFDISADLVELGKTPVTVVCSGVKSILDIPKTLEYLETQGVCVGSYNNDYFLPDFYTPRSSCQVTYDFKTPSEVANLIRVNSELKTNSGILVGVPVPAEFSADKETVNNAIQKAVKDAEIQGIKGKAVTPFILSSVARQTKGNSLSANIALIKNNAKVAAKISKELSNEEKSSPSNPVVIGASIADLCMKTESDLALNGATFKVDSKIYGGGVGRNLAEGLSKFSNETVNFISTIARDQMGDMILKTLPSNTIPIISTQTKHSTSVCSVVFDKNGDCKLVLGDMSIHNDITPEQITQNEEIISSAPIVVIDGNMKAATVQRILEICGEHNVPVFYEPTDMNVAAEPFHKLPRNLTENIKYISPNIYELEAIYKALISADSIDLPAAESDLERANALLEHVGEYFDCIILTLGAQGVMVKQRSGGESVHYPLTKELNNIVNVSGAGDSFVAGFLTGMLKGLPEEKCVAFGFYAAERALLSESPVPREYFSCDEEREQLFR
ncbi:hypothetical protein ACFFRR_007092 [Megaselia abdita]